MHDGNEAAPSFDTEVNDGWLSTGVSPAMISFTNVNDVPVLESNTIDISEGQTLALTSSHLNVKDTDTNPSNLTYSMTNVTGGCGQCLRKYLTQQIPLHSVLANDQGRIPNSNAEGASRRLMCLVLMVSQPRITIVYGIAGDGAC